MSRQIPDPTPSRRGVRNVPGAAARYLTPIVLLAPAVALLGWLLIYPGVEAVRLSLTEWSGFGAPVANGLGNFKELLHDQRFKEALLHNLLILAALPVWIGVPYAIAWSLHNEVWGWRFFRFAFFLPVVFSPVVMGLYYGIALGPRGPLNSFLGSVGLDAIAAEWLNDPSLTLPVVITILIWSTFGVGVLIFLGALSSLDNEQVQAAMVDGASPSQIQRHVVFWQLLPVIEFWTVLIVIISFTAVFPLIFTLTKGGPGTATYTVDYDIYVEAFTAGRLGYAAAGGVVLVVIMAVVASVALLLLRWRRRA